MKSFTCKYFLNFFIFSCFFSSVVLCSDARKADLAQRLQIQSQNITLIFGGKYKQEYFGGERLTFLNANVNNDVSSYARTTGDFFADFIYGDVFRPRIMFHDTWRFRFRWGGTTEVKSFDTNLNIAGATLKIKGVSANKHVMWTREAWMKVAIGNLDYPNNHFMQIGLLDYQVGRGISYGAAYSADGFLGFSPGYSIDQFAPAVLLSINPLVETYTCDFYIALLENNGISYATNNEIIRQNEIGACPQRGVGRQSYVAVIRNNIKLLNGVKDKLNLEPYIVYQAAPDQDLEFTNDVDSYLTTYGCAIEQVRGRFNWGAEAAINTGVHEIKPWDRNLITLVRNDQGFVTQQYTKVFIDDPNINVSPRNAYVTDANAAAVKNSPKDRSENGKQIGTDLLFDKVDITENPVTPSPYFNLFNAFDRFRPKQRQFLKGYFFVVDGSYEFIEKVLTGSLGVGYASGYIDQQRDANKLTQSDLLNQEFTGFIPLQSAYQGKRLSHLIIFNVGIPRFNVRNPGFTPINVNATKYLQPDGINEMTNIAFFGSRFSWNVQAWKEYKVNIAPNVIGYWSPETSERDITKFGHGAHAFINQGAFVLQGESLQSSIPVDNYIGTEISCEFAAIIYDRVKLEGYAGMLIPGKHYRDLCGTPILDQVSGADIAYLANFGLVYTF